jgi:hypothetical protein
LRAGFGDFGLQNEKEAAPLPLWQLLVTDGHVQAARIRAAQPWLTSFGIGLILLGALLQFVIPAPVLRSRDQLLQEKIEAVYAPAVYFVDGLGDIGARPRDSEKLTPGNKMPEVVKFALDSLNATGKITSKRLILAQVSDNTFWQQSWPLFNLISTGNRKVKIIGAIVNLTDPEHLAPARWLGVFREHNGRWQYVSLARKGFYATQPAAQLRDIAVDLIPLMPPE